jgi:hypothetical protein
VAAIQETDPAFETTGLMSAMPDRYLAVYRATEAGDEATLRLYLAPALLEEWPPSEARDASEAAEAGSLGVQEVRLIWAERVLWEDRLTLAFDCLRTSGEDLDTLTEYWTLGRRRGVRSATGPVPTECPSCGAPVDQGADVCRYCQSTLPGPLQDWLLDRVDRDVDWYEGPPGFVV